MVRDAAHTDVTLSSDSMTGMCFNGTSRPVELLARAPAEAQPGAVTAAVVRVICHARAGIEVLQPKGDDVLWQESVPYDVSMKYSIAVDFGGQITIDGNV